MNTQILKQQTCPRCAGSGSIPPEGSDLRAMRDGAGFSQGDLARLVGVSVPFISKVERGVSPCSPRLYGGYLRLQIEAMEKRLEEHAD